VRYKIGVVCCSFCRCCSHLSCRSLSSHLFNFLINQSAPYPQSHIG
jgi:hypothetical protein